MSRPTPGRRGGRGTRSAVGVTGLLLALAACGESSTNDSNAGDPMPGPTTSSLGCRPAGPGAVWVANEGGNSLSILDATTHRVVTTVSGIGAPHNVQAGPDGSRVWAVSGTARALVAIDAATYELRGSAATGSHPAHVVISPDGGRAYVTNAGDGTVSVYDTEKPEVLRTRWVAEGVHGLRPTAEGTAVAVAGSGAGTLVVVDGTSLRSTVRIPVGKTPVQVAMAPDGRYGYVSLGGDRAVAKVDLEQRRVLGTIGVPADPVQIYLTPDGKRLLSADQGTEALPGRSVSVIDTTTMTIERVIPVGAGPHGVVVEPAGCRAWVTNLFDDTVSVLDLAAQRVIATVPVGDQPNGVSFATGSPTPVPAGADLVLPSRSPADDTGPHEH